MMLTKINSFLIIFVMVIMMVTYTSAESPQRGGTIVFPIYQDPKTLNPYLAQTGETSLIGKAIYEGLTDLGPDGKYYPRLAQELPTKENGRVSEDGLTITWKLRENVFWSDGELFTSDDVKFTWEAVTHPKSIAFKYSPGWDLIESVETLDDHTAVVRYKKYYYNYLDQFSGGYVAGILPRHACGDPAQISQWECNRKPIGTGPFILKEWRAGESITLVHNPNFRESDKPHIDKIIFPIIPDENVRKQMLVSGEGDALLWFNYEHIEELEKAGVSVSPGTDQWLVRLWFNLSKDGDTRVSHPILGDKRVRKAIQLAVDPHLINNGILDGRGKVVTHELFRSLSICPEPKITYSKKKAKLLLEEAGWIDQDEDGIRECHGCLYAKEGDKMVMRIITWPEPEAYARMQQLVTDELADVGIELNPNIPDDQPEYRGDYDIALWDEGYGGDPTWLLKGYYASSSIPKKGSGEGYWNIMRFNNTEFDTLLAQVQTTKNSKKRLETLCQIDCLLFEELPVVWLVSMPFPDAYSARLRGWQFNPNDIMTWDIANWKISQ